MSKSAVTANKK